MVESNDHSQSKLAVQAVTKFCLGALMVGVLLFLPAGTFEYWQGWLLVGILFIPMFIAGIIMLAKAPDLLASRLNAMEDDMQQKWVIALTGIVFFAVFVIAGLGVRFGWYALPAWVSIVAAVLFLVAYALFAEVLRENAFLSRTVKVQEGQTVVDTGLYGIVRHPMYTASLLLFLSMPLVLGSLFSFFIMLVYLPLIAVRIRNEEKLLESQLDGYLEYEQKVPWRLIPHLW